tara:strand:- start:216 stop:395 length:180 start_codon:yes stop_codon:yes gene_type:complete
VAEVDSPVTQKMKNATPIKQPRMTLNLFYMDWIVSNTMVVESELNQQAELDMVVIPVAG